MLKNLFTKLKKQIAEVSREHIHNVPHEYITKGYRRLAENDTEIGQHKHDACWTCKHAVGYITWQCEKLGMGCTYEKCYTKEDITEDDYNDYTVLPGRGWLGLPPKRRDDEKL